VLGCVLAAGGISVLSGCFVAGSEPPAPRTPSASPPVMPTPTVAAQVPQAPRRVADCALLTTTQVQEALGAAPLTTTTEDNGRACLFYAADGARVLSIRVGDLPRALIGGPEEVAMLTASPSARTEHVPGLADAAVFYSDPASGNGLAFARSHGNRVTSVDILASGPCAQSPRDTLVALGRQANASLP
jgi:hypothetical protein